MDSLTHIVLGGCLGHLALGKKAGRKAVVWGAIADTIPDFDVFAGFWVHPVDSLLIHRGFTHSILFAILCSIFGGWGLSRWYKKFKIPWKSWSLVMALGLSSHLFIDSLTNYGTGLLEPFSNLRFAYTTIFIADPAFTLPMLLAFVLLLRKNPSVETKTAWAKSTLVLSSIYLIWTFINRSHFETFFKHQFQEQKLSVSGQSLTPAPLNNVLWSTMARTDSGYYSGYHSLLGKNKTVKFSFIPANDQLSEGFKAQEEYLKLKRFANGYSCISLLDGIPYFHDLRFGTSTGWTDQLGRFTFNYPLERQTGDTAHLIEVNPWPRGGFEAMGELWQKIKGN